MDLGVGSSVNVFVMSKSLKIIEESFTHCWCAYGYSGYNLQIKNKNDVPWR